MDERVKLDRDRLIDYAIAAKGEWSTICQLINDQVNVNHYGFTHAITLLDKDYPESLLALRQPPFVLFYKGNIDLLVKPKVSIVGSRIVDSYGQTMTQNVSHYLKDRYTIVSGLAKGVDALAAASVLHDGSTIAILGCGIERCYPRCNRYLYDHMAKYHLILSEYPFTTAPLRHHFPMRNRIIAALGDYLIVTSATMRSGTMISVTAALELGKDVYCIPYGLDHENGVGCNYLIQQGAQCIYDFSILPK